MAVSSSCGTGCVGVASWDAVLSAEKVLFDSSRVCTIVKKNKKRPCRCSYYVEGGGNERIQREDLVWKEEEYSQKFLFFFKICFSNCCALVFDILLPFYGAQWQRPHPWLGFVAVIIPHKQGLLCGKGSSFFFFFAFYFGGLGKGKQQRGDLSELVSSPSSRCTMCS